jgi:excisionase family DNA binding protein
MEVYTVQEVADKLKLEYKAVLGLIKRGYLKALPGIRHKRIPASELNRYLDVRATLERAAQSVPASKPISARVPATSAERSTTAGKGKITCNSK